MMPEPGQIIDLPATAVYLANEPLRLRVERVADGKPVPCAQEWVTVYGQALNDDGTVRGTRSALVDARALRRLMAERGPDPGCAPAPAADPRPVDAWPDRSGVTP